MLNFLFIILIFLEIAFVYFAIIKINELNKKIIELNKIVVEKGEMISKLHIKTQKTIHKINSVISILTNQKLWQIKKVITSAISVVEIIIILQSFNFKKGVKFNLKNVKVFCHIENLSYICGCKN